MVVTVKAQVFFVLLLVLFISVMAFRIIKSPTENIADHVSESTMFSVKKVRGEHLKDITDGKLSTFFNCLTIIDKRQLKFSGEGGRLQLRVSNNKYISLSLRGMTATHYSLFQEIGNGRAVSIVGGHIRCDLSLLEANNE